MTALILIPWAQNDWQSEQRLVSHTSVSVNTEGQRQVQQWIKLLQSQKPTTIYSTDKDPAAQTARQLAEALKIKHKKAADLQEVHLGLWEGLTTSQLKQRFSRTYKQWREDPPSIYPPEGEDLTSATQRLTAQIRKLTKKHEGSCFGAVLGPIAFSAIRCNLENKGLQQLWNISADQPVRYALNLAENKATGITDCGMKIAER